MPDIGDFIRQLRRSANFAIAARAHLAIFADRGDRRIKSPGVSLALLLLHYELLCGRQESSNIVHLELFNWLNTDWSGLIMDSMIPRALFFRVGLAFSKQKLTLTRGGQVQLKNAEGKCSFIYGKRPLTCWCYNLHRTQTAITDSECKQPEVIFSILMRSSNFVPLVHYDLFFQF